METGQDAERPSKIRKLNPSPDHETEMSTVPGSSDMTTELGPEPFKHSNGNPPQMPQTDHVTGTAPTGELVEKMFLDNIQGDENAEAASPPPKMSKNAMKKLKRREEWEANRDHRKAVRKEKDKAKKARKREENRASQAVSAGEPGDGVDGDSAVGKTTSGMQSRRALRPRRRAAQLPVTFIIDCSWDEYMWEKEIVSMTNQLTRCYSDNYKANFRAHLAVSSFGARLKDRFDNVLSGQYKGWKGVRFLEEDVLAVAAKSAVWTDPEARGGLLTGQFSKYEGQAENLRQEPEIVYLSSDSEETLTELKPYSVYIIGGLIDKNRYKGASFKKAQELGIKTAKLPIGDYMKMSSRFVLTINHVNEIMLKWLETGDWGIAFEAVIPKRKGGVLKDNEQDGDNDAEGDGDEEHDASIEAADRSVESGLDDALAEDDKDQSALGTVDGSAQATQVVEGAAGTHGA